MGDARDDMLSPLGLVAAVAAAAAAAAAPSPAWDLAPPPPELERQWPPAQRGLGGGSLGDGGAGAGGGSHNQIGSFGNVTLGSLGSVSEAVHGGGGGGGGPRGPIVLPTHSPAEWGAAALLPGVAGSVNTGDSAGLRMSTGRDSLSDLVQFGGGAASARGAPGASSWREGTGSESLGLSFNLSRGASLVVTAEGTARVISPPTAPSSPGGGYPGLSRGIQSLSVGQDL